MSIDIVNVSKLQLKRIVLSLFNELNQTNVDVPLSNLVFEKTPAEGKVLLQNPTSKMGVLLNKINIQDLFPKMINLRPFTQAEEGNAILLEQADVPTLNAKHATELVTDEADILNAATSFDNALVKKFVLFCRVFGFYELGIGDVTLNMQDDVLTIMVVPTNTVFTGYVEVLV